MNVIKIPPPLWLYLGLAVGLSAIAYSLISEEKAIEEKQGEYEDKITSLEEQLDNVPTIYDADLDETVTDIDKKVDDATEDLVSTIVDIVT